MLPMGGDISPSRARSQALRRCLVLASVDVDSRIGKVRNAAGVIEIEVREDDVLHIVRRKAERPNLGERGLFPREPWRYHPQPRLAEPRGRLDITRPEPRIHEQEAARRLDEEHVADHSRSLEKAAPTVHEPRAHRAERGGIEMVDLHGRLLCQKRGRVSLADACG